MSFKLFIYYCAVCGAWAAFLAWGAAQLITPENPYLRTALRGLSLGFFVAMALGMVDALWNLSGHQYGKVVTRGFLVALAGCVAGFLGGLVGQMLFNLLSLDPLFIVGWTLAGLLIGASIGLFDLLAGGSAGARKKVFNGLIGGTIGGGIGGALSLIFALLMVRLFAKPPSQLLSSSAWGFVALGASIGLFIGLAQVILKEAWVKVETGPRAGRELILTKDETTIGRAEACDIGLFGDNTIEKTHARIVLEDGQYLLVDAGTPSGTYLNDERITKPTPLRSGDLIRVGKDRLLRFSEKQKRR